MSSSAANEELHDLVENHLSRGGRAAIALGGACAALGRIAGALQQAYSRTPNWNHALNDLRAAAPELRAALGMLKGQADLAGLVAFGERQLQFAELLKDEIVRLQAGESTLV